MLSIGKLGLGQQRYYEQQVAEGRDDYYSGRGEAPGEWRGVGAGRLGLRGRVDAGQFNALLAGADPRDPSLGLRASNSAPAVAAFDLTFSAPKSVSVLYAIAPGEVSAQLVDAHERAVGSALAFLERDALFVRRGKGGYRFEHAGGLIAASYRHRMSRALDPQLHTHVVAANLAVGEDGRYTALHHPSLYRAARTAGYIYQAELRALVRERLGLEWGPVRKGAAELALLPAGVLGVFSQRRAQIEAVIVDREAELGRGLTRAERERWGAIATRDRKQYGIDTHTWREEVAARAAEHGLDHERLTRILEAGERELERGVTVNELLVTLDGRLVEEREFAGQLAGPGGLTELANTFDVGAVLREFAAAARQGVHAATLDGQAERFVGREDVLASVGGRFTTSELVGCERRLIDHAVARIDNRVARLNERDVAGALADSERVLGEDQAAAVFAVATSGNGVDVIEALAGTGKTYTAAVLREVYERAGYTVAGVAPTGRAARELVEQAGIASRTLDSQLLSIAGGRELAEGSVLVFDEAGMASTRQSERLLACARERGVKVVAIGDPGQLASVQAGGWLRAVGERVGAVRLSEVMRQRDHGEVVALAALHDGGPGRWVSWAVAHDRVEIVAAGRDLLDQAVGEWREAVSEHGLAESVMLSRDNQTRDALNALAREQLAAAGQLGEQLTYGPVTVAVGERVICRDNERGLDVDNGTRGTVRHVQARGIEIETDAHLKRELPADYVAEHVEHAYALTGHGTQGGTVEHAIVVASPHELTRGWSYTALSRARGRTRLFIYDAEREVGERREFAPTYKQHAGEDRVLLASVARRMRERDDEDLAVEQLEHEPRRVPGELTLTSSSLEHAQERGTETLAGPGSERGSLRELRERIALVRTQLAALPVSDITQLAELDARAREITSRRDGLRGRLERLPAPRPRRLRGGVEDPAIVERVNLTSALTAADLALERTLSERATLTRQLGDLEAIRQERDQLTRTLQELTPQHHQLRDELVTRELAHPPQWAVQALGERPEQRWERERWDRAAKELARYRIEYEITGTGDLLGERPSDPDQRALYDRAERARQDLARQHERPGHELDFG